MQLIVGELRRGPLRRTIEHFDIQTAAFSSFRALFAVAQLSIVLATPYSALMQSVGDRGPGPTCDGLRRSSIYCITRSAPDWVPTVILSAILIGVVLGVAPRVMSVAHAWACFSIATSISLPDGGDQAAAVFSILLIAVCASEGRRAAWCSGRPASRRRCEIALGGLMVMRVQVAAVYLNAAVAKLFEPDWRNGTAEFYILRDPFFGASGPIAALLRPLSESALVTVSMTWGAIIVELLIAVLILCGPRSRSIAFALSVFLHGAIILMIGLWSFGLVMIAAVGLASIPATPRERAMTIMAALRGALRSRRGVRALSKELAS